MEERSEREEKDSEEEDDDDDELVVQFKNLQQYWDSLQSNPGRILRSSSDTKCPVGKSLYLLKNCPTNLMSSLQRRRASSPLRGVWKVRTNDLAVEEILRERRAAIESGKVKGRRLFWGMEGATEMDLGYSDSSDLVQDSGIRSVSSGSSGSADGDESDNGGSNFWGCSRSGDDMERNKIVRVEANMEEKRGDNARRWRVFMGWVCIALVLFTLGFILLRSFEGDGDGNEVFLVPTWDLSQIYVIGFYGGGWWMMNSFVYISYQVLFCLLDFLFLFQIYSNRKTKRLWSISDLYIYI